MPPIFALLNIYLMTYLFPSTYHASTSCMIPTNRNGFDNCIQVAVRYKMQR